MTRQFAIFIAMALVSGCSLLPWRDQAPSAVAGDVAQVTNDFQRSRLIATDLSGTMVQLPELAPQATVVYTARPPSRFGEILLANLQRAGYDLRMGDHRSGNWLDYSVNREATPSIRGNPVYTFLVSFGQVKLKRSYEVDAIGVQPTTTMYLLGADASNVVLDESLFSEGAVPAPARKSLDKTPEIAQVAPVPVPEPLIKTPLVAQSTATAVLPQQPAAAISSPPNMYVTRKSAFENELAGFSTVRKEILVFANDSLFMGKQNKRTVRDVLGSFNPDTDVMSVIGCSHGNTNIDNGNQLLAVGRAKRVAQELLLAGVESDKVFDEGCWAPVHFDEKMPRRGVVLLHKRRQS